MARSRVLQGDCLTRLKRLPANSVDLTVTSPPYDSLRKYAGLPFDKFQGIAEQLFRVTKPGGVCVWVVNDATVDGSETGTSFRQALYFKDIGFRLHDTMIYSADRRPMKHNRYDPKFEYMFVLSKGAPKTFNPFLVPCKYAGEKRTATYRQTDNTLKIQNTPGQTNAFKYRGNIWHYNVGYNKTASHPIAHKHPAIFPEKLAEDHVLSWSNPGDLVLDPFFGAGTTGLAAKKHGRRYLGIELSREYIEIARARIQAAQAAEAGR